MKKILLLLTLLVPLIGFSQTSPYCGGQFSHFPIPNDSASAVFITLVNTGPSSMLLTVESATPDTINNIIVPGGSGAAIGAVTFQGQGIVTRELTWAATPPDTVLMNVLWGKANNPGLWQLSPTDFKIAFNVTCPAAGPKQQVDLPITFDDTATVDYNLFDFNGAASSIIVDPTDPNNLVAEVVKGVGAQGSAGTIAGLTGLANPIPFAAGQTKMSVRVWSPDSGIVVRLKVENNANGGINSEAEDTTTMAGMWETLEFDFDNSVGAPLNLNNVYDKVVIFFNFGVDGQTAGAKTYYFDDVAFIQGISRPDLPITFEDTANVDYDLTDFGGNTSQIVVDPTNSSNLVAEVIKDSTAGPFSGTSFGELGLARPIPFDPTKTKIRARVWSPDAGTPMLLKVEDAANGAIAAEVLATTTMAGMWETLEFDFSTSTNAPLNFSNTYNKISLFPNFNVAGSVSGRKTYYVDDIAFVDSAIALPLPEFCNTQIFHLDNPNEVNSSIFLTVENSGANSMKFTITSANADPVTRLLVNNSSGGVPQAPDTTVAGVISRELTWPGTAPDTVSFNVLWSKVSLGGGNWQYIPGAGETQTLFNTVCVPPPPKPDLPLTFEDTVLDYNLSDFAGAASQIVTDPTDPTNKVVETLKTDQADTFAGTTAGADGLENAIPFSLEKSRLKVRVWSPDANIPVRLKIENSLDGAIATEAEVNTTVAMQWETLTFNFLTPAPGQPAVDFSKDYDKITIFFNFGTDGQTAGAKTYFWDDVEFDTVAVPVIQPELPVTFEDSTLGDYNLLDFEGAATQIVTDPTDSTNTVGQTLKTDQAATFAGTVVGAQGFLTDIPFDTNKTRLTMRVWSPDANTPVRIKVENRVSSSIASEAEAFTTAAQQWETLTFDFSDPITGPPVDLNQTYGKAIVFFNFGTDGQTAGAKTYFWDDLAFLDSAIIIAKPDLPITFEDTALDYSLSDFGGAASLIVTDPTDPNNRVVETLRTDQAVTFAGTTAGDRGLANAIPFTANETLMSVRVWSPAAGVPVRLKVENNIMGSISVETEDTTTKAQDWEYLVFDFSNQVTGAPLDVNQTYDKVTIFFNFGAEGSAVGAQTYYWDDVAFGDSTGVNVLPFLEEGISVYPNPANNLLNVRFENIPSQPVQVKLFDLNGRVVKQIAVQNLNNAIQTGDLQEGMYLMTLESKDGLYRQKVMIRR